jgi:hypothetical protein
MEILGNNHEVQMAQGHLFLSLANQSMSMTEARENLIAVGSSFVEKYQSILPNEQALIYQYGVHPNGSLIDLRDITQQLKREWVATLSIGADFSCRSIEGQWTLGFAPSHYVGRVAYGVPVSCNGTLQKVTYASNGTIQSESEPQTQEANTVLQVLAMVLDQPEVVSRADVLLTANTYYVEQLARLSLGAPLDLSSNKKHQNDEAELRKLIGIIRFK